MSDYVHALKFKFLTPFYDSIVAATMREGKFRKKFVDSLDLQPGQKVLDIGCGTGSLLKLIKQTYPEVEVIGIDGDPEILEIAKKKAKDSNLDIRFETAMSDKLLFEDKSIDVVVSSLVFHHLTKGQKLSTLKEIHRVLKDEAPVHILDWSKPTNKLMRLLFFSIQILDGFETTKDNINGSMMVYMSVSNFKDINFHSPFNTVFGTLAVHSGIKGERVQDMKIGDVTEEDFLGEHQEVE